MAEMSNRGSLTVCVEGSTFALQAELGHHVGDSAPRRQGALPMQHSVGHPARVAWVASDHHEVCSSWLLFTMFLDRFGPEVSGRCVLTCLSRSAVGMCYVQKS